MNRNTIEADIQGAQAQLANHVLVPMQESGPLMAWYLRPPTRGYAMSVLILRHPEGLTIQGDLATEGFSTRYGLAWFVSELSASYMAEKFFRRDYSPDRAAQQLGDILGGLTSEFAEVDLAVLRELADGCERVDLVTWCTGVLPLLPECWDATDRWPPSDYPHASVMWLAAIQRTFRRLFWERYERFAEDGTPIARGGR